MPSCQIDQSVNLLKEKLFSDSDNSDYREGEKKAIKKKSEVNLEEERLDKEKKIQKKTVIRDDKKKTNTKIKGDEKISDNKTNKYSNDLDFKGKGQARDTDSKIISFFTKIFESEDEEISGPAAAPKNKEKFAKELREESEKKEELIIPQKIELSESEEIKTNSTANNEIEQDYEITLDEEIDTYDKAPKSERENIAFLQFKDPKKEKKEVIAEVDNLVGLLLPLTGKKSAAGNLVINSLRYSMLLKPNQLNFKIFDTRGIPKGAIEAAEKGVENGINTFIGPIFSNETKELKRHFKSNEDLTFFSLSPDLENISKNIIVSGQNPEEQVSCIIQQLAEQRSNKILLIFHADKYGYVIRDSFSKFIDNYGISQYASVEFFEMQKNMNLNDEIKKLSKFEDRKRRLKNEISRTKNDKTIEKNAKKIRISSLERKLTLDTPFDSILIASEGDDLLEILSHLAFYDINSDNTNIYGTSLWEDTDKNDNVYRGTFYATSLKDKNEEFVKSFKNVFSREPLSLNFYIHDLIDLVQSFKDHDRNQKANKVFYGEFSNSKINSGLLQREIYIRRINKDEDTEEVSSCRLDEI